MDKAEHDWRHVLAADIWSMGMSDARGLRLHTNPLIRFVKALRRAEAWRNRSGLGRLLYYTFRFLYEREATRLGFDIPLGVFGPGLSIAHRGTIVVNGAARVGRNCRLHPGVTIGAHRGSAPTIGDDVFIGPSVSIIGGVSIGNGAVLSANASVNFDVPAGGVVVPAQSRVLPGKASWVASAGELGPRLSPR
ncbi:serine acetyltransferase [Herbiconiux sp. SYSU D00978]|uniref:serine acetyltransferase n=1 Tax=Herbiconiux sp. SYSU D00978 TaxID=2812562 RepID=UPI0035AC1866